MGMMDDHKHFQVGDIVTRHGHDRFRLTMAGGDLVEFVCIREPLGWLKDDGTRHEPWIKVGGTDWGCANDYYYPDAIEGEVEKPYITIGIDQAQGSEQGERPLRHKVVMLEDRT